MPFLTGRPLQLPFGSACVGPRSAEPAQPLLLSCPPLFTLLGSTTRVFTLLGFHPAASMNVLNVAQSVVIYTGMAAGLLVCTKVRGAGACP